MHCIMNARVAAGSSFNILPNSRSGRALSYEVFFHLCDVSMFGIDDCINKTARSSKSDVLRTIPVGIKYDEFNK